MAAVQIHPTVMYSPRPQTAPIQQDPDRSPQAREQAHVEDISAVGSSRPSSKCQSDVGASIAEGVGDAMDIAMDTVSKFTVDLIDDFRLTARDLVVNLPMGCQRLVALVALADRPIRRSRIAATLWPDTSEERARANLRSALWRVSSVADVLVTSAWHVGLADGVAVDYRAEVAAFNRLNDSRHDIAHDLALAQEIGGRCGELLPDWGEDWVMVERERFRQIRLQTIDALGERLCESGRYRDALRVVLAGMAMDPLRESPHRLMVKAHLRLGNVADAIRQYRTYERLLDEELGVQPTRELTAMLAAG